MTFVFVASLKAVVLERHAGAVAAVDGDEANCSPVVFVYHLRLSMFHNSYLISLLELLLLYHQWW